MTRPRWSVAAFVGAVLVGVLLLGAWGAWAHCGFSLLCEDGVVARDREFAQQQAQRQAAEKAWHVEHPDKEFLDGYQALPYAHLPTLRGLFGSSFLLENGRLLSPKEALGLRMGLNADLPGTPLQAQPLALVASPRSERQQDILWSDGRLTRNQHFDGRTGTASPGRWTEDRLDSIQIDDGVALASGGNFRLVLRRDGTVWGYGGNDYGQAGVVEDNQNDQWLPLTRPVAGLNDVQAIAAGSRHALALKRDGTVWQWGANHNGYNIYRSRTRDDVPAPRRTEFFNPTPSQVRGLAGIIKIATGLHHNVALDKNGVVWAWGDASGGLLGIAGQLSNVVISQPGNSPPVIKGLFVDEPVQVPGLDRITDIAAAGYHTLALKQDGTVWGWGSNDSGQIGVREYKKRPPSDQSSYQPFPLFDVRNIQRIFTSADVSALLDKNGDVFVMGRNRSHAFVARIPGQDGRKTQVKFSLTLRGLDGSLDSEVGLYVVDDTEGRVNGLLPGDAGYASAALGPGRAIPVFVPRHRHDVLTGSRKVPETSLKLDANRLVGLYTIFNSDRSTWSRDNPKNVDQEKVRAYFSFPAANPDGLEHLSVHPRSNALSYTWDRAAAGPSHPERRDEPYDFLAQGLSIPAQR